MDKNEYGSLTAPAYVPTLQIPQQHRSKLPLIGLLLCVGLLSVALIMVIMQHNTLNSLENSLDMYQQIMLAKAASAPAEEEPAATAAKGGLFTHTKKKCAFGSQCPSGTCNRLTSGFHCAPVDTSKKAGGEKCWHDSECQSDDCKGMLLLKVVTGKCASVDWSRDPDEQKKLFVSDD